MRRILLSIPHMGGDEERYVREAFASNWLSTVGPNLMAFRAGVRSPLRATCGRAGQRYRRHTPRPAPPRRAATGTRVSCRRRSPSPRAAIQSATSAPSRFSSTATTATWDLDPNILEDALGQRAQRKKLPRALVVVHLYGQCADMDPILALCRGYDVPVLEDAAEALGAKYHNQPAGTIADVGAFSFNGNKIITDDRRRHARFSQCSEWVEKARFWAQQARDPGLAYEHSELGYNYRMSNVLAGIGRGQLEVLDLRVQQRRAIAFHYRDAFADLPRRLAHASGCLWPAHELAELLSHPGTEIWLLAGRIDPGTRRACVESRPVWKPMHLQPLYARSERLGGEVAEDLFRRGICLPSSSSLSWDDQLHVVNAVRRAAGADALCQMIRTEFMAEAGI